MALTLHTNHGSLKFELQCELTPLTAKNFLALAAAGWYDNKVFHRNIRGFILQGGAKEPTGKGGISIYDNQGYFEDEFHPTLRHNKRGVLAMANRSKPNTNLSQFYVSYAKQPQLDNLNTVFGQLIDGFDTLDRIEHLAVDSKDRPVQPIVIESITIHANPFAQT